MLAAIYWNPPREAFYLPFLNHPVMWYGVLFVLGFIFGYWIMYSIFKNYLKGIKHPNPSTEAVAITDTMTWMVVLGTVVGARLGHVLFYAPNYYLHNPLEIFQTWKGGLASHGGAIGILIALYFFSRRYKTKYPELNFIRIVDFVAIPAALAGFFIRLGNLMNQEILGTPSNAPWAVIFGNPADGSFPIPRHPVVLYEGLCYLFIFVFLFTLWKRFGFKLRPGIISGIFFILVFSCRLVLEYWKSDQLGIMQDNFLQTGQYLSIPFIILGFLLYFFGYRLADKKTQQS
jgi:prolipoprotein diacylglyceryl transferase